MVPNVLLRIIGKLKSFFFIYIILEMPVVCLVDESSLDGLYKNAKKA